MMVSGVTTAMNGSTIYCSEHMINGNANGAPMVTIAIINKDQPLNVTMMNHFLKNSVTVTLQWPREPGAVYSVDVSPEVSHTELFSMGYYIFAINLTISYNIQYNVSIVSSLCGITTTKVLKYYVTCDLPTQLSERPVIVYAGSQESPPIEGQFITYTCPPGFVLNGSNASVCTENGEWEPDPGELDCIADCGVPLVSSNVKQNYSSALEGSILILTCGTEISNIMHMHMNTTDEQIITVTCHSSGNWIPDPTQFTCSPYSTETSPLTTVVLIGSANLIAAISSTMIIMCAVSSIVFLSVGCACGWFSQKHRQSRTRKLMSNSSADHDENTGPSEGSQLPPTPGLLYEELQQRSTPEHQDLVKLKENVAYGPIVK